MTGLLALAFAAGMVAPVNPCGFALLPGWVTLALGDTHASSLALRLSKALRAGLALTLGFAGTLVAVGLLVSAGARALIRLAPQLGFATGVALVLLALLMLTGRSLPLRLPAALTRRTSAAPVVGHSVAYGIGFATASLSCTFGVLLAVIAQAQATATYAGQIVVFGVYAAGSATVLVILATGATLAGTALTRPAARIARHGHTITAAVLALTGAYLAWYWYPGITGDTSTGSGRSSVSRLAAPSAAWAQSHTSLIAFLAFSVALLAAAFAIVTFLRNRRGTRPRDIDDHLSTPRE